MYVQLKNNGSTAISSFTVSYNVEKYRKGSNSAGFSIQMYYSSDGSTWTSAGADFLTSFSPDTDNTGYTSAPGVTTSVASKTLSQALNVSNSLYLAWNYSVSSESITSNAQALGVDDISIKANGGTPTPTISLNPTSLTGFTYVHNAGPSTAQSFAVTSSNLTGNLSVTTSGTDYVVSATEGGTYGTSLSLIQSSGSVSATVYVKLASGLAIGTYHSQNITVSGDGATDKTVTCSGSVTSPPAPSAPTATTATSIDNNSFSANWGAVSGATGYRLDVYTKTSGGTATDLFISEYLEGSSNNKYIEIYNGTGTTVDLDGYFLRQYNGASTDFGSYSLSLTGASILDGSTYVIGNSSGTIYTPDLSTNSSVMQFNGNDAVALFYGTTLIDIIGSIGDESNFAKDVTMVRKAAATVPNTTYSAGDWDSYAVDTTTYLGSHTMTGGSSITYVSGYEDLNVSNVLTYSVTGLSSGTTYSYVVRAYDAYAQTSANSNEIEAITTAAVTYDYPEDVEIDAGEVLITIAGGSGNIDALATPTPIPNPNFTVVFEQVITLFGDGLWLVSVFSLDQWVACYFNGIWTAQEPDTGYADFLIELGGKNTTIELKSGNGGNPTLPVELSSFTVALNAHNNAVLTWVTQSETNVSGFYIYRNAESVLATASMISELIPATNTSQQRIYIYSDKDLLNASTYYYWLQVVDLDGSDSYHGPISLVYEGGNDVHSPGMPKVTELKSLYPNPFNPSTTISYGLDKTDSVNIKIFNSRGQLVRSLDEGLKTAGYYHLIWNGDDASGKSMPTGVYYIRMQAGHRSFHKKAVLMK